MSSSSKSYALVSLSLSPLSAQIFGFEMEANKKFRMEGEVTEASILAFAQNIVDGTAEAEFKSAAIPAVST